MAEKKVNITFRCTEEFRNKVKEKAENLEMSQTEFIETVLQMMFDFDPVFIEEMHNWAEKLKLPMGIVIQNFIIRRLGLRAGKNEFWEKEFKQPPGPELLEEFQYTDQGPITGEKLFNFFKDNKYAELKEENIKILKGRVLEGGPLDDTEEKFLKKHKAYPEQSKIEKARND